MIWILSLALMVIYAVSLALLSLAGVACLFSQRCRRSIFGGEEAARDQPASAGGGRAS